jgi:uncharacterized repeat protein (TIGR01451 family)
MNTNMKSNMKSNMETIMQVNQRIDRTAGNTGYLVQPFLRTLILFFVLLSLLPVGLSAQAVNLEGKKTINQCEQMPYTIRIENTSGQDITEMVITANTVRLPGFTYVPGSTAIAAGGAALPGSLEPVVTSTSLTWDIDALQGSPFTLAAGQTLEISFTLETGCDTETGYMNIRLDYVFDGQPTFEESGEYCLTVLKAVATITKTPRIIEKAVGEEVTWELEVSSTGLGYLRSVRVKDILGAGLTYVSSTPVGTVNGNEITWDLVFPVPPSPDIPQSPQTISITALVSSCDDLINTAHVSWGCDTDQLCYSTDPAQGGSGVVTASVQRIVTTPLIAYAAPDIAFDYCGQGKEVTLTVSNTGDGTAYDVWSLVDFGPLTVTDVSAGAQYLMHPERGQMGFLLDNPLAPAGEANSTYQLSFTLSYGGGNWCDDSFPSGELLWQKVYKDVCGKEFFPPVEMSHLTVSHKAPILNLDKTSPDPYVRLGGQITYNITSEYLGALNCNNTSTGSVTVLDTLPSGFTVVDNGGGTYVPGAGGTGGTITWTYTPSAPFAATITLQAPGTEYCDQYCGKYFKNEVTASVTDCCGCPVTKSGTRTSIIACGGLVSAEKIANPTEVERCGTVLYTNTYNFYEDSPTRLNQLHFEDHADRSQRYVGDLQVMLDSTDITGCISLTDNTPGGYLIVDFAGCADTTLAGRMLTVSYRMAITEASIGSCRNGGYHSYSTLDQGLTGEPCAGRVTSETYVSIEAPAVGVAIARVEDELHTCDDMAIRIIISRRSDITDPKDVRVVLSGMNYYVADPASTSCRGVAPVSCTPSVINGDYVWDYGDRFSEPGQQAFLELRVQKRCGGSGELQVTAYYDDLCTDDETSDGTCSSSATRTPPSILTGDLIIEKTPELVFADDKDVEWKIYVTNRGTGTAYNVWVDDQLGTGLSYFNNNVTDSVTVDNMTGVTITPGQDHTGASVTGRTSIAILQMLAGERREITFKAAIIDCQNLTNDVYASWGCGGEDCQNPPVTDHSEVRVPGNEVQNTGCIGVFSGNTGSVNPCSEEPGVIILKNTGQTAVTNLEVTATVPGGVTYIPDSTRYKINNGPWIGPAASFNPVITGTDFLWTNAEIPELANVGAGDTIEMEVRLTIGCERVEGAFGLSTRYSSPCSEENHSDTYECIVNYREPNIFIDKTCFTEPIECGESLEWVITVRNDGQQTVPVIWVEDVLDAGYTFVSAEGDPVYTADNGTRDGQTISWEVKNLPSGATATMKLTATANTSPCSIEMDNTVYAWWGCGDVDGSSSTKPGAGSTEPGTCLNETDVKSDVCAGTWGELNPEDVDLNIVVDACGDEADCTVTITNTSDTSARYVDLEVILPRGGRYVENSSQLSYGGSTTSLEPVTSRTRIIYLNSGDDSQNLIDPLESGQTAILTFKLSANCFDGETIPFRLTFDDCCHNGRYTISRDVLVEESDIAVSDMKITARCDTGGQTFSGEALVEVTNNGTAASQGFSVNLDSTSTLNVDNSANSITILAAGATQTLRFPFSGSLADCSTTQFDFTANLVSANAACECNTSNNSETRSFSIETVDLEITAIDLDQLCRVEGGQSVQGPVNVTIRNNGSTTASNFTVTLATSGCLAFDDIAVQQLAAGASMTVAFIPTGNWQDCTACNCTFTANVLPAATDCECSGTNNARTVELAGFPDLTVDSLTANIDCVTDGSAVGTTVVVGNSGCSDVTGATVRLTAQCGVTFDDQTVDIPAGETRTLFFPITNRDFIAQLENCTCTFTAVIDPDNAVCECSDDNNERSAEAGSTAPDLLIKNDALIVSCMDEGRISVSGTVTVENAGCGAGFTGDIPVTFTMFGGIDCTGNQLAQWTSTLTGVNIPARGGEQTFTIPATDYPINLCTDTENCTLSIRAVIGPFAEDICENAGNNTYCTNKSEDCIDLEALEVKADMTCESNNDFKNTISVTLRNSGGSVVNHDFSIRVEDGGGWVSQLRYNRDLGGRLPLNPGQTATVVFDWTRTFNIEACKTYNINALVDSTGELCQCSAANDTAAGQYEPTLPNLLPTAIAVECMEDGFYRLKVTVENNGCAPADNFKLHMEDDKGNSKEVTYDGTLKQGQSAVVEITRWPAACAPEDLRFTASVGWDQTVCELEIKDNIYNYTYTTGAPDLQPVIEAKTTCTTVAGQMVIKGSIDVTVSNKGNEPVAGDFKIAVDDGRGWSTEKFYGAELNGKLPINAGESVKVTVDWDRDFAADPAVDTFDNITVTLDQTADVCECVAGNNKTSTGYNLSYPSVAITGLDADCIGDGEHRLRLSVTNNGSGDLNQDFQIHAANGSGKERTATYTSLGGTLPLRTGQTVEVLYDGWLFDCSMESIKYTVTLDPARTVCMMKTPEPASVDVPGSDLVDLLVDNVDGKCNEDGSITFTVSVRNKSTRDIVNVLLSGYDSTGKSFFSQSVSLPAGITGTFDCPAEGYPKGQTLEFRFVVDEDHRVCECDGDNEKRITVNCPTGGEGGNPGLKITKRCPPGQEPGGVFRFDLIIENTGDVPLYNVMVKDTLPDGFQYAPGSSALDGQAQAEPQIGPPLTWNIGSLGTGQQKTLVFSAVADADIDPDRYCNRVVADATVNSGNTGASTVNEVVSNEAECCTVVVRRGLDGCCLKVEEWPLGPRRRPEGPLSFIEPYFNTETSMFTVYAALNLWKNTDLDKGTWPRFMKERMINYARSTVEEFYLRSRMGLTLPGDDAVWLSVGGAYPEQESKEDTKPGWKHKNVDHTMTSAQVAFELLGLNEILEIEKRDEIKQTVLTIIKKKINFMAPYVQPDGGLPHGWQIRDANKEDKQGENEGTDGDGTHRIRKLDSPPTPYDLTSLYLAMAELEKNGFSEATAVKKNILKRLEEYEPQEQRIKDTGFNSRYMKAEFIYILAMLEDGKKAEAGEKIKLFESQYDTLLAETKPDDSNENGKKNDDNNNEDTEQSDRLAGLQKYALATAVDYKAGGSIYEDLAKRMKEKFFLKDAGVFADHQPDLTYTLSLRCLAPLLLYFDGCKDETEQCSIVMFRSFDEIGLFLDKRNLEVGKPLYSIIKNYSFPEQLLPVLTFTKAKKDIAPVFSRNAVIHSTLIEPIGEILVPDDYSKILSPGYENGSSAVARLSFGLQYLGRRLMGDSERDIKEDGRSLDYTGKQYIDSLLGSGAGHLMDGRLLLPFDDIAIKGPIKGQFNLEPLDSGNLFSTETLANYLLAEKLYVEGKGKQSAAVKELMKVQAQIVGQLTAGKTLPKFFYLYGEGEAMTVTPYGNETASRITAAKLYHVLKNGPNGPADNNILQFLETVPGKTGEPLEPVDLVFLTAAPELVKYFETEIKDIIQKKDSMVTVNCADILGRRLLGDNPQNIEESVKNLALLWDKVALFPKADRFDTIEGGLICYHEPQNLNLYLLAAYQGLEFQFKRTLNFFAYLLENEWGVETQNGNAFLTLPSAEYRIFLEKDRKNAEPGDLINFKVRVDNTCPEGVAGAFNLGSLYLKAGFLPHLRYTGTERVDGLTVLDDFKWHYNGLVEGAVLEYVYQAYVPLEFRTNMIDGWIYAGGRRGFEDFGPGSGVGDDCEDIHHIQRFGIVPFQRLQGVVYEDRDVSGERGNPAKEVGIPNILFKDTRGRYFRSDAEGRFTVLAGDQHEGVQIELKELPAQYLLLEHPTRMVNRHYVGEIHFGLVPCKTVTGFVFIDENQNGSYDAGETRLENIVLRVNATIKGKKIEKEAVTGNDGKFIFHNLPEAWIEFIEIKSEQPHHQGNIKKLKITKLPFNNK